MLVNGIPDFLGGWGSAYIYSCAHTHTNTHMPQGLNIEFRHLKFEHSTQANSYFYCTVSLCRLSVPPSLGPYLVGNISVSG